MAEWGVSEIHEPQRLTITQLKEEERPREKLMGYGPSALTNAELLAILIGSGNTEETAVKLMERVLGDFNNNLAQLSKTTIEQLKEYKGIGEAKAISILAACELGRRREREGMPVLPKLDNSAALYDFFLEKMRDLPEEAAYLVLMTNSYKPVRKPICLSHGGITETAVDVRVIMRYALMANATIIAIAHNHPSGNTKPSRDDEMLTKRVAEACSTMRIFFADHIIVTDGEYYSFRDNGKI